MAVGAITMDGALEGKESGEKLAGCKKAKETESSGGLGATMEAKEESAFMCCQHGQYGAGDWLWVPANAVIVACFACAVFSTVLSCIHKSMYRSMHACG